MILLEELYEFSIKKTLFFNRRISIEDEKTLIIAPKMSGVSSVIFDYLLHFKQKEYLYIDLFDFRVSLSALENLQKFINLNSEIKILVIENYNFQLKLPEVKNIILTSSINLNVNGFVKKLLYPLDFEEYISFDKKFSNIEHIFSHFSNSSTYPEFVVNKNLSIKEYQNRLKSIFCKDIEIEIIKELSRFQSEKTSIFQIFNIIKQKYKISKDSFYKFISKLQDEKFIFFIRKYNSQKALRKLYFLDFNLKNKITTKKHFIKKFENILFLELIKRDKIIEYSDNIEFYLPQEKIVIISIPFFPLETIEKIVDKIVDNTELEITKIIVITMEIEKEYQNKNIKIEIMPFWNFVFSLN